MFFCLIEPDQLRSSRTVDDIHIEQFLNVKPFINIMAWGRSEQVLKKPNL